MESEPICRPGIVSCFYDGKSFKEREVKGCPLTYFLIVFSFMVAKYIFFKLKTLNLRHFKCISYPLVFCITAITTDNVKYFGYVILTFI